MANGLLGEGFKDLLSSENGAFSMTHEVVVTNPGRGIMGPAFLQQPSNQSFLMVLRQPLCLLMRLLVHSV